MKFDNFSGVALVIIAALLWATDGVFRSSALAPANPAISVFVENLVALIVIVPWALITYGSSLFRLRFSEWLSVLVIGFGGGAAAGILFNVSMGEIGFSSPMLIQKLQPIFVVLLAFVFLKERSKLNLFPWSIVAVCSAMLITIPDAGFNVTPGELSMRKSAFLTAFCAMFLWAASTVAGKKLLATQNPTVVTFWRFLMATIAVGAFLFFGKNEISWSELTYTFVSSHTLPSLMYLGLVSGLGGMWIYYAGLRRIPASVATFLELFYPLVSLGIGVGLSRVNFNFIQMVGGTLLLMSVLLIVIPKFRT